MAGVIEHCSWSDLNADILNAIAERLLYVEQIRFRSVCKSWRSNIIFPIKHAADKLPWVMSCIRNHDKKYSSRSNSSLFYLYDPSQHKKYTLHNQILCDSKLHASKHGWLLLSHPLKPNSTFTFYSPFTHDIITLPELHMTYTPWEATFSTAPTSPDCLIFVLTVEYKNLCVSTCSLGDRTWRTFFFEGDYGKVDSLAFVGGVFYCLFSEEVMGSFNVEQQEWRMHPHPNPRTSTNNISENNVLIDHRLIESPDGNLLAACYRFDIPQEVFRYDKSEKKWLEVEHLGNRVLFISVTSMLLPAVEEATELANTIHRAGRAGNRLFRNSRHSGAACFSYFNEPQKRPLQTYGWVDKEDSQKIWIQPIKHT